MVIFVAYRTIFRYVTQKVQDAIAPCRKFLLSIHPNYKGKIQVIDVSLNKPFKTHVSNCFDEHMIRHADE